MKLKLLVVTVSIAFAAGCAQTPKSPSAEAKPAAPAAAAKYTPYTKIVDFAYVRPHATPPIDQSKGPVLIDSRPTKPRYDIGHIPGAINLVDPLFDKQVDRLPKDKNREIIFYCQGLECDLSHHSAYRAEKLGYTNIKVYAAGVPDWEAKGEFSSVSTDFINKLIADKADVVLVDSRPERTVEKGTIPGAINIPDNKFDKETAKLPTDKAKALIFFCGGLVCDLSEKSAKKAKALGYKNVRVYAGGYPAWSAASAVKPAAAAAPAAQAAAPAAAPAAAGKFRVETAKDKEIISTPFFERVIKENPAQFTIVDVRRAEQFNAGSWPGAIGIPFAELEGKLASLPKDKPIIFTCSSGAQSSMAHDLFLEKGYKNEAYILDAEVELADGKLRVKK